jgi:hypothetical protein
MADQSDVETAIAGVVGGALYPGGLSAPCAVPAAICRIYRGWPVSAGLDADLAAGRTNVSIVAISKRAENTTRWPDHWSEKAVTVPTLFVAVAGDAATFSGVAAIGQVAALIVDGVAATCRTESGDTPADVAATLARVLTPMRAASASGATVTVPGARSLVARVEADQPVLRQTRRQRQAFRVTCWCPDPTTRDAVGATIDAALSGIDFIGLADGTSGRLRYLTSAVSDRWEDAVLYRRELTYSVDYPTTIATTLPRMAVGAMQFSPNGVTVETLLS